MLYFHFCLCWVACSHIHQSVHLPRAPCHSVVSCSLVHLLCCRRHRMAAPWWQNSGQQLGERSAHNFKAEFDPDHHHHHQGAAQQGVPGGKEDGKT